MNRFTARIATICSLFASTAVAQLPVAKLNALFPTGAKQGTSVEVQFEGGNLEEPSRLYFTHPGITSELLPAADNKPVRFKVNVAGDVPVGWYDVRFVGKHGISNPRTFLVGEFAEVEETEDNDTRETANRVEPGRTINGRMKSAEDTDWFVVPAKAGQRLIVECLAWRIDSKFDGALSLTDGGGRILQSSQDEAIRAEKTDPLLDFQVPADGDYYIKLTDFIYSGGGAEHFYRLNVGTQPLIDFVLPTSGKPGETTTFTVFGRNLPGGEATDQTIGGHPLQKLVVPFALPADYAATLRIGDVRRPGMVRYPGVELRVGAPGSLSNGRFVGLSTLAEQPEIEPNNAREQAQRIAPPCAITGQFNPSKDRDVYVFAGKKETRYTFEILGQRIGSPVDADLEIFNAKGDPIHSGQDDGEGVAGIRFNMLSRDVRTQWQCGEDGDYYVACEHLFAGQQGGPQYVYRLEVTPRVEDFQLICIPVHENQRDSHLIEQGGRLRVDVVAWRLGDHNAPITVNARNLPPGVTCEPFVMGPGVKLATMVLSATADAPLGEAEFEVVGTSTCDGANVERIARGGAIVIDTNNTTAISRMTRSIVLAVRRQTPYLLTASPNNVTLKQGEPLNINVQVERKGTFAAEVKLTGAGYPLPPNLQIPLVSVPNGQGQGTVTIDTNNIPPGQYSFIISGEAQVPYEATPGNKQDIRCVYPSNPITITVNPKG